MKSKLLLILTIIILTFSCSTERTLYRDMYKIEYNDAPILSKVIFTEVSVNAYSVTLSWNEVEYAAEYEIATSTSEATNDISGTPITTAKTSYTITDLSVGTSYHYFIRAVGIGSVAEDYFDTPKQYYGPYSDAVNITTKEHPSLTAETVSNGIQLSWESFSSYGSYTIYKNTEDNFENAVIADSVVYGTTVTVTGLVSGTEYYFWVKSGSTVSETAVCRMSLSAVTNVSAARVSSSIVRVSWDALDNADTYRVCYSTSSYGTFDEYTETSQTDINLTGLTTNTTYYIKVAAMTADSDTAGKMSNTVSVSTAITKVTGVRGYTTAVTPYTGGYYSYSYYPTFHIEWDASPCEDVVKYKVTHASSQSDLSSTYWAKTETCDTNSIEITASSYLNDANQSSYSNNYYVKVAALDADGNAGADSAILMLTFRMPVAPATFSGVMLDDKSSVKLTWESVNPSYTYRIYRKDSDEEWSFIAKTSDTKQSDLSADTNSLIVNNLVYHGEYIFGIQSVDEHGLPSAISEITVYMYPAPQNVTVSNVTAGTAYYSSRTISCDIYWDTVPEASGYYVYYKAADYDSWRSVYAGNADFYSFNRSVYHNDKSNSRYYFRVEAIIGGEIRVPSETVVVSVEE